MITNDRLATNDGIITRAIVGFVSGTMTTAIAHHIGVVALASLSPLAGGVFVGAVFFSSGLLQRDVILGSAALGVVAYATAELTSVAALPLLALVGASMAVHLVVVASLIVVNLSVFYNTRDPLELRSSRTFG